jgi:hypothetical protein
MTDRKRELALFNLAIDSKLRGCDLVQLRVRDVAHGERIAARTAPPPMAAIGQVPTPSGRLRASAIW